MPRRHLLDDRSARIGDERGAVEHELVLAAHAIDVDDREAAFARARLDGCAPVGVLSHVVRRAVRHHDERCARVARLRGRIRPPDVLADHDADRDASRLEDAWRRAGSEIARLVEHRVVGQRLLAVHVGDLAGAHDGCRVVQRARGTLRETDDDRLVLDGRGERCELARARVDEGRPQQEVLGRVAAKRQLGRDHELGVGAPRRPDGVEDRARVGRKVADALIELRHGEPHAGMLAPG